MEALAYERRKMKASAPDPAPLTDAALLIRSGRLVEAARLLEAAAGETSQPGPLLLEAGRLFLRAGEKAAARRSLEGAVIADPALAGAQMNLGLLLAEQGDQRGGRAALEAAHRLRPDDPDIAVNLAALEANVSPPRAIERLTRLTTRHPGHRLALANLAQIAAKAGLYEEAIATLDRLIALEPSNPSWRVQRAASLLGDGRLEEARADYEKILDREPDHRQALAGLARLHRVTGEAAAETDCQRRLLALDPDHAGVLAGLARLGACSESERAHLARLASATDRRAAERYPLCYALYHSADRARDVDPATAFAHLAEANRLKGEANAAGGRRYDAAAEEAEVEGIMRVFDAAWFERIARSPAEIGDPSERPVFVLGMPRSGTTLCEQILASHSQIGGLGERADIARIAEELAMAGNGLWPDALAEPDPARWRAAATAYLRLLDRKAPDARRVVDKTPTNFRYLGLIAALFPRARIVHARRGPMDVCFSCFEQNFAQSYRWSTRLEDLGHYYGLYRRLMAHWQSLLPRPIFDWHYESVVEDLEPAARRLVAFCGLAFEPGCLAFHETRRPVFTASLDQVRRPLYKTSVRKWRRYEMMLSPLAESLDAQGIGDR
jgi:tetratricopeptide (TPR) repeat protein